VVCWLFKYVEVCFTFVDTYSHVHACHIFRLQPLIECFDDDGTGKFTQYLFETYIMNCYGTGWISVKEANQVRIFSVFPLDSDLYCFLPAHHVKPKGLEVCNYFGEAMLKLNCAGSLLIQPNPLARFLGCWFVLFSATYAPHERNPTPFISAGWHASIWSYQNKICGLLMTISIDLKRVLHTNRVIVDAYFSDPVFLKLDLLIRSVVPTVNHDAELERRMSAYVQQEEHRMEQNLEAVEFDIDDQNTLSLITGPGRIERVRENASHGYSGSRNWSSMYFP